LAYTLGKKIVENKLKDFLKPENIISLSWPSKPDFVLFIYFFLKKLKKKNKITKFTLHPKFLFQRITELSQKPNWNKNNQEIEVYDSQNNLNFIFINLNLLYPKKPSQPHKNISS
jgi:hypothetical protein